MKIICPDCNEIIEIDEENIEPSVVCPSCKMKFPTIEGKKAYDTTLKLLKNRGHKCYLKFQFNEALECYKEALNLEPNDLESIVKYGLNLLYSQRFDNLKFKELIDFLDSNEIILNSENTYTYLGFLETFLGQAFVFIRESNRLMIDDTFINEKYFNYYYNGLKEIKDTLEYFKNVFNLLKKEDYDHFKEDNDVNIDEYFKKTETEVNSRLLRTYNINHLGDCIIEEDTLKVLNSNKKDLEDIEVKDLRVIIPNEKIKKLMKLLYIGSGSLIGIAAILLILGISLKNSIIIYISFIPMILTIIIDTYIFIKIRKENNK